METDLVSRLEEAADRFVILLRMNEGFDELALLQLQEQIDRCGTAWTEETPYRSVRRWSSPNSTQRSRLAPGCTKGTCVSGSRRQE